MIELSEHTEALARRLAAAQDLSVDETVRQALEAREAYVLPATEPRRASSSVIVARRAAIERAVRAIAELPERDGRSSDEIMDDLNS